MAVVEHFPTEPTEPKSGPSFLRTDVVLPKITGVFTARKDGSFMPRASHFDMQQSARQPFVTGPIDSGCSRKTKIKPWPGVDFTYECDRTSLSTIKSMPEVLPSTANEVSRGKNSFVLTEPGFLPTCSNFKPAGGLLLIDRNFPHIQNAFEENSCYQVHTSEICYMDENIHAPSYRQKEDSRLEQCPSSCFSRYDSLLDSIPYRINGQQDHFKEVLNLNFSETIELYKTAVECGLNVKALSPSLDHKGCNKSEPTFSWEHIKRVLDNEVSTQMDPSFLRDLIDLDAWIFILNRRNCNNVSDSGNSLPPFSGRSHVIKKNSNSCVDWVDSRKTSSITNCIPTGPSTQTRTQTQAKNVTSIPYGETHMEAMLRSSTAQLHSCDVKTDNHGHHSKSSLVADQADEVKEQRDDVYLGRYPCLRDVPHLTNKDQYDENTPIVASDDSSENSPDIIIRPRPPSEDYDHGFEHESEEFQPLDLFYAHQPSLGTHDCTLEPTLESFVTTTSSTDEVLSLTSSYASGNSRMNQNWRGSDNSPLSTIVTGMRGFRRIAPKTEGSDVALATRTSDGGTSKLPWKAPKKKPRKHPNHCLHLWEFLLDLLNNHEYSPKYIAWTRKDIGEFKLIRTEFIANLWGQSKRRKKMTYEKMARALRYYYKFDVLEKVPHKRLHFRFGKSILPRIFNYQSAQKVSS